MVWFPSYGEACTANTKYSVGQPVELVRLGVICAPFFNPNNNTRESQFLHLLVYSCYCLSF